MEDPMEQYDVVWETPSKNSAGSMPIGNGDIGLNVWVDEDGDILFYIGKTDAWSGNGRLLKLGRIRLTMFPSPSIEGSQFRQILRLSRSEIEISGGEPGSEVSLRIWVDANQPVIRVEVVGEKELRVQARLEVWRKEVRQIAPGAADRDYRWETGESFSAMGITGPKPVFQHPDRVMPARDNRVVWFHRNTYSIYPKTMRVQALVSLIERIPDPLLDLTLGGCIHGDSMMAVDDNTLVSAVPAKSHLVSIYAVTKQTKTEEEWIKHLEQTIDQIESRDLEKSREAHQKWWESFWNHSWIRVSGEEDARTVSRGYQIQRFINACGGRGDYPIKFNGSVFTVDAVERGEKLDADYRRWGPCYWFQNTRLIYWPMLASGDFGLMLPLFKMYRDALALATERTRIYYDHDGAFFPETIYFWGVYQNEIYGWNREGKPPGLVENRYLRYYWSGGLELSAMMLDYFEFTEDEKFARKTMLPLVSAIVTFFDQHWGRNGGGKIRFEPAQSLETWWGCVNPLPEIAGLRYVLDKLLLLPTDLTTENQRREWKHLLGELPSIPTREVDGRTILAPADEYAKKMNIENPELYAIFPYQLYGVGKPDLEVAELTFEHRLHIEGNRGHDQDDIHAAYLGLTEKAREFVVRRLGPEYLKARFPAFWHGGYDWLPDQCHGGVGMIALQAMLMQCKDEKIVIFPAWPKDWNVEFKLHAPHNTTVEGVYRNGKLEKLRVSPETRAKDILKKDA